MKVCKTCGVAKPLDQYTNTRPNNKHPYCKICRTAKNAERRKKNPELYADIERRSKFKRIYGITIDDYYDMLKMQNNGCGICGAIKPSNRTGFFSIDHCHTSGKVRGLLCTKCNRGLGLFNDSPQRLQSAVSYLLGA